MPSLAESCLALVLVHFGVHCIGVVVVDGWAKFSVVSVIFQGVVRDWSTDFLRLLGGLLIEVQVLFEFVSRVFRGWVWFMLAMVFSIRRVESNGMFRARLGLVCGWLLLPCAGSNLGCVYCLGLRLCVFTLVWVHLLGLSWFGCSFSRSLKILRSAPASFNRFWSHCDKDIISTWIDF